MSLRRTRRESGKPTARWHGKVTRSQIGRIGSAESLRCLLISRESLARFGGSAAKPANPEHATGFDMDGYLARHGFEVLRRKPWQSRPGGFIFELSHCPFD